MDTEIDRQITALETQIARLDPRLAPAMEAALLDQLGRLIEIRDRDAPQGGEGTD